MKNQDSIKFKVQNHFYSDIGKCFKLTIDGGDQRLLIKQSGVDITDLALRSKAVWSDDVDGVDDLGGPVVGHNWIELMSKDKKLLEMLGKLVSQRCHWMDDPFPDDFDVDGLTEEDYEYYSISRHEEPYIP